MEKNSTAIVRTGMDGPVIDLHRVAPYTAPPETTPAARLVPMLRRHRVKIAFTFTVFVLGACIFSLVQTPLYRAKTVLEIQGFNRDFLNSKDFQPVASSRSPESFLATQTKLIRTESLAKSVVERSNLTKEPAFYKRSPFVESIRASLHLDSTQPVPEAQAVGMLIGRTTVKPEGESDLLNVTVDSPDPKLSAALANEVAQSYLDQEQDARSNNAVHIGKWLGTQLEEFRSKLQQSEDELQRYAAKAGLVLADDHTNAADDKLRQVQQELSRAQADRADKQSQLEVITASNGDTVPRVMDDGSIRELKTRLADLKRQYADLTSTLTPTHYKVERVRAQMMEVEDQLNRERTSVLKRIKNEYDAAVGRERLLQNNYDKQTGVVTDQATRSVRYNILKREVETNRQLYSTMLQKVNEASVLSAIRTNSIRVVDTAKVPDEPYRPSWPMNIAAGLLGGFMVSAVLVLALERNNRTIREPGDATARLHLRELGAIPSARFDPQVAHIFYERIPSGPGGRGTSLTAPGGPGGQPTSGRLVTLTSSQSLMAESFRSTAISLTVGNNGHGRPRVIVFTSPRPKAGKSTTAANLAVAMSNTRNRVLLIEGDLRRPQVHSLFRLPQGPGLSELLTGEIPESDLSRIIRDTRVPGLQILTGGGEGNGDPGLLRCERLEALLLKLRLEYGNILIDAPPLLQLPDARILSQISDGVVVVCRAGETHMDDLDDSLRVLQNDGATVLGTILNDWDPRVKDPAYYRSYYSSYVTA